MATSACMCNCSCATASMSSSPQEPDHGPKPEEARLVAWYALHVLIVFFIDMGFESLLRPRLARRMRYHEWTLDPNGWYRLGSYWVAHFAIEIFPHTGLPIPLFGHNVKLLPSVLSNTSGESNGLLGLRNATFTWPCQRDQLVNWYGEDRSSSDDLKALFSIWTVQEIAICIAVLVAWQIFQVLVVTKEDRERWASMMAEEWYEYDAVLEKQGKVGQDQHMLDDEHQSTCADMSLARNISGMAMIAFPMVLAIILLATR